MLKLSDNPPPLSFNAASPAELPGTWWIAHTKSRSEKALAWDLTVAGIGYFLPMSRRTTFSGGRKRQVLKPLFPSYLFVCGTSDETRYKTLTTGRASNVLPVTDQSQLIAELTSIHRALAGSPELDLYPFAAVGKRCRVTAGPMMGIEGIVVQRTQRATLVLEISLLKQGAALEIGLDLLEPVEED